jgi:hypothetical protein
MSNGLVNWATTITVTKVKPHHSTVHFHMLKAAVLFAWVTAWEPALLVPRASLPDHCTHIQQAPT